MKIVYIFLCLFICFNPESGFCQEISSSSKNNSENYSIERKITKLLNEMTLEEKVGQLTQYSGSSAITGPIKAKPSQIEDIKNGKVGSMLNVAGTQNVRELQKLAVEKSRLGIPLIFGFDVIHGYKTIFPIPLAEAASWNLKSIEKSARIAAIEASSSGINWTFAPMVDISRDARWGRVMEGAGEDPFLGALVARARIRGFQGSSLLNDDSVVACAKHFAGYGAVEAGREYNAIEVSRQTLNEIYLRPFKAAVDEGVGTFMTSFSDFESIPSTCNTYLLRDKLKEEWKFNGFVVSDYNSVGELIAHGVASDLSDAARLALQGGNDMDMASDAYRNNLAQLVKTGKVSIDLVNDAVRRVLRVKYRLGLFDNPYKNCNEKLENQMILRPEHLEASRSIARESVVLLKNDSQILPLSKELKTISVIGYLADSKFDMMGNWSAFGNSKDVVTVLEGIKNHVSPSTKVFYEKGCNVNDTITSNFDNAIAIANKSDVVVLVMGELCKMSGEASSRSNISIPGMQERLLDELLKTGKPIIVIMMNGRPLDLSNVSEKASAILEGWFLGTQGGNAISDVLFGNYNPSGKLPISFPRKVGQVPIYYNHKNTGRPKLDETSKWVSHYIDLSNEPLYPFGYGLSYSTFEYSPIQLDRKILKMKNDSIKISVTIKNSGKFNGEEVVQLYVRDLVGSVSRPVKELKQFKKLNINSGESVRVDFILTAEDLAFFTKDMSFKTEPGEFQVFVGSNSVDCKSGSFSCVN